MFNSLRQDTSQNSSLPLVFKPLFKKFLLYNFSKLLQRAFFETNYDVEYSLLLVFVCDWQMEALLQSHHTLEQLQLQRLLVVVVFQTLEQRADAVGSGVMQLAALLSIHSSLLYQQKLHFRSKCRCKNAFVIWGSKKVVSLSRPKWKYMPKFSNKQKTVRICIPDLPVI